MKITKRSPEKSRPEIFLVPKPLQVLRALAICFLVSQGFFNAQCLGEEKTLVDIEKINPRIRIEIRYATTNNFMKEILYPAPRALALPEVAQSLSRIQEKLEKEGLGLKIFDAYRPLSVQKKMWKKFPIEGYIANPLKGSNHNRGAAVDLTLVDKDGKELPMPSEYDEFSERAHQDYAVGPEELRNNRKILREAMEREGFKAITTEWWHYDYKDAKNYPVLDLPFESVEEKE